MRYAMEKDQYRVFVVIVVYRRLDATLRCLESLSGQTFSNFEVIVVDHCEADVDTPRVINEIFPQFKVIKGNDSMWWTEATNFGINYILQHYNINKENDLILTLNNDLTVPQNYLSTLLEYYDKYSPCLIGSVSVDAENPERIDFAGNKWSKFTTRIISVIDLSFKYSELIKQYDIIHSDLLPGRGTLFPIILIDKIGLYDSQNFPHYFSDFDFSYRAKLAGYKLVIPLKCIVLSSVNDSGLRFDKGYSIKPTWANFRLSQKSIKSPTNYIVRYNWARKYSKLPLLYFTIESMRNIIQFGRYFLRYYFTRI